MTKLFELHQAGHGYECSNCSKTCDMESDTRNEWIIKKVVPMEGHFGPEVSFLIICPTCFDMAMDIMWSHTRIVQIRDSGTYYLEAMMIDRNTAA